VTSEALAADNVSAKKEVLLISKNKQLRVKLY